MKRLVLALAGLTLAGAANASSGGALPYTFKVDTENLQSVQRGAANYMSYCSGCHSMKHLRYVRMGRDLNIPDDMLKSNLMFTSDKIGEPIRSALPAEAAIWFGLQPPDLTLETRMRGPEWVYNYLLTFYIDTARPSGVNNLLLPGASMPHVLGELQGWQVKEEPHVAEGAAAGHDAKGPGLVLAKPGTLTPDEYRGFVRDTVNFMAYAAEPGKAKRIATGAWVILYLLGLTVLAYFLKKEWWKDVH